MSNLDSQRYKDVLEVNQNTILQERLFFSVLAASGSWRGARESDRDRGRGPRRYQI